MSKPVRPWPALWALILGFFMIMVDATIVSVANPEIMRALHADINSVIWVTSAYLLAYAVPMLVTGRLGDRFGPRRMYLLGLVVFTLASAWCGLSGTIAMLIAARVVQGIGAALIAPQSMAVVTRIFPANRRGAAMSVWGAAAGLASLVGPIVGGVLVGSLGWQWIFFVNVPIGVAGFILAWALVPDLPIHAHRFDVLGVVLSGVGMFLVVFGVQEGEAYHWGVIAGPVTVWGMIAAGLVVLAGFVVWQYFNRGEPLMPLRLFRDRNFSLCNGAIVAAGFLVTTIPVPLFFYFQLVLGMSPLASALMVVPMAALNGILAPVAGHLADRIKAKYVAGIAWAASVGGLAWYAAIMVPHAPVWALLLPSALLGFGQAGIWSPISATITRSVPPEDAGAGSGVFNISRQVGCVLGSACIAVMMEARIGVRLPGAGAQVLTNGAQGALPPSLHAGFSAAMGESMLLPAAVSVVALVLVAFLAGPAVRRAPHPSNQERWTSAPAPISGPSSESPDGTTATPRTNSR